MMRDDLRRCWSRLRPASTHSTRKRQSSNVGDKTGISWTDSTWGPVRGCSRISPGCQNCYAERIAGRFSGPGRPFEDFVTLRRRHPPSPDGRGSDGVRHMKAGKVIELPHLDGNRHAAFPKVRG